MKTYPLTPRFGREIKGIQLSEVTEGYLYPEIRNAFETHSALLFRDQDISDDQHKSLSALFGPVEDRYPETRKDGEGAQVSHVSNVRDDGSVTDEMDFHTLNLKANMLWHADSTFLPVPALANILIGRVVTQGDGMTELASTRAGWADMPEALKAQIRGRGVRHHLSVSRRRISETLAKDPIFHKWPAQHWKAVWANPVTGEEALYLASHAFGVDGLDEADAMALIDELIAFVTQPAYVYTHHWRPGDVLIWDQRAVLHRATPWDYAQPRTLTSFCVSATEADGLDTMRV
jgi:alpha-ketoglutarate-dependent 2,4-dichlorophenoxyacetate dioxygenase